MEATPRTQHLEFALQSIWPDLLIIIVQRVSNYEQPCFALTHMSYLMRQLQLTFKSPILVPGTFPSLHRNWIYKAWKDRWLTLKLNTTLYRFSYQYYWKAMIYLHKYQKTWRRHDPEFTPFQFNSLLLMLNINTRIQSY